MGVMVSVESGDLKLTDASEIFGVSYRQVKRIRKRYLEEGDIGLVHSLFCYILFTCILLYS